MIKHNIAMVIGLFFVLYICYPTRGYTQQLKEVEFEFGMLSSNIDPGITLNTALKYNSWFNPYIGWSIGGQGGYSTINQQFDSPINSQSTYSLKDKIIELNGIVGLKLASPVYRKVGIMADCNILFDPIPFNFVSVSKSTYTSSSNYYEENSKDKIIFTRFNISYALQLSLFYDLKKERGRSRFAVGCGVSNHNSFNAYYLAKVDAIRLKDQLKLRPDKIGLLLFVRFSGF